MKSYSVRVGKSSAGLGLFAAEPIRRGDRVIEYTGERISAEEADRRGGMYLFEVTDKITIDGSGRENIARYINYSCRPNCEAHNIRNRIFIVALRNIKSGEELTYDYGEEHVMEHIMPRGCRCDSCKAGNPPKYKAK